MTGSASINVALLQNALSQLEQTQATIMSAKSNVTDIGIHLNTSNNATTDAIGLQLKAISVLREAINTVQAALLGTANTDASATLVWLNQIDLTLEQDSQQLQQIKTSIQTLTSRAAEIANNANEEIGRITSVMNVLRAQIGRVG